MNVQLFQVLKRVGSVDEDKITVKYKCQFDGPHS